MHKIVVSLVKYKSRSTLQKFAGLTLSPFSEAG